MKKAFAVILILALMFTLCGCRQIDTMRDTTAYWQDEGRNTILWNGEVYERTDFDFSDTDMTHSIYTGSIKVISKDLPLLLRNRSHDYAFTAWDNAILVVGSVTEPTRCYCRTDKLEAFKNDPPDKEFTMVYVDNGANRIPAAQEYADAVLGLIGSAPLTDEEEEALGEFVSYNGVKAYLSDDYGLFTGFITESTYENGYLAQLFLEHYPEAEYACSEELHKLFEALNEDDLYYGITEPEPAY